MQLETSAATDSALQERRAPVFLLLVRRLRPYLELTPLQPRTSEGIV